MGFFTSKKEKEEKKRKKQEEEERKAKEAADAAAKAEADKAAAEAATAAPAAGADGAASHTAAAGDAAHAATTDASAAHAAPAAATHPGSRTASPAAHPAAPPADASAVPPLPGTEAAAGGHATATAPAATTAPAAAVGADATANSTPRAEPSPQPNRPAPPPGMKYYGPPQPGMLMHQHQHQHMMMAPHQHYQHQHMYQHGAYYAVPPGAAGHPPGAVVYPGGQPPRVVVPGYRPPAKVIVASLPASVAGTTDGGSAPPSAPASPSPKEQVALLPHPSAIPALPAAAVTEATAVTAVPAAVPAAAPPHTVAAKAALALPAPAAHHKADSDDDGPQFVEDDEVADNHVAAAPAAPAAVVPKAAPTVVHVAAPQQQVHSPVKVVVKHPQFATAAPTNGMPKVVVVPPSPATAAPAATASAASFVPPAKSPEVAPSQVSHDLDNASASFASTATVSEIQAATTTARPTTPPRASTALVRADDAPQQQQSRPSLRDGPSTVFDLSTTPALSPERSNQPLTPAELGRRLWVQERFAKLVCPQQYFGRITRVHNVKWRSTVHPRKPIPQSTTYCAYAVRDAAEAAHLFNEGFDNTVADGSHLFASQVQLDPKYGRKSGRDDSTRITTYALCELPNERARFAETVSDATEMLQRCDACFVTDVSAFVVSSLSLVTVHALVDVTWTMFSEEPAPQCSVHRVPLQLFDPAQRNLLCALCTANDENRTSTIVLNDLFSGASLKSIQGTLNDKLANVNKRLHNYHGSHRQTTIAADRRRHAVELQFSLVQAALDAKKAELMSLLDEDERTATSAVTRHILTHTEIRRHLLSSLAHLRGFAQAPAADAQPFAQMATVVSSLGLLSNALEAADAVVPRGSNPLINESLLKINMEHVIRSITEVSFTPRLNAVSGRREPVESPMRRINSRLDGSAVKSPPRAASPPRPSASMVVTSPKDNKGAHNHHHHHAQASVPSSTALTRVASHVNQSTANARPQSPVRRSLDITTLGPNGTCLFDTDVRALLLKSSTVEWKLRIDDPGTWIGIGVRVGDDETSLGGGDVNESRHLWIAPPNVPRVVKCRVVPGPHGTAKLTIHDTVGRQLDDNRIPHWNKMKAAFPQVSFGSERGSVTMIEMPHPVLYQARAR